MSLVNAKPGNVVGDFNPRTVGPRHNRTSEPDELHDVGVIIGRDTHTPDHWAIWWVRCTMADWFLNRPHEDTHVEWAPYGSVVEERIDSPRCFVIADSWEDWING